MRSLDSLVIASLLVATSVRAQAPVSEPAAPAASAATAVAPAPPTQPPPTPAKNERVKILVMDIAAAGLDAATVENITGLSAVILADDRRLDVLSGADVKQMAALEGEKQALGCTNDASCLAEVAGAMGAGLIVYGNGGKLGTLLNLNLNLFDAAQARSVGRVAIQAKSLEELPEKLRPALQQLVATAIGAPEGAVAAAPPPSSGGSIVPVAMIGGGAVVAALGVGTFIVGALPASTIAGAEEAYRENPNRESLALAAQTRADWYDNGAAPALLVTGGVLAMAGLAAATVGVVMMTGGAE